MKKELHVISTGKQSDEQLMEILYNIYPYITAFHIREKERTERELSNLITNLLNIGVPQSKLMINDRADVAECFRTRGVQLPYHGLDVNHVKCAFPRLTIGCSVHAIEEARYAEKSGAHFLLYGHIYPTASKEGKLPQGLQGLREITSNTPLPVIAIGGIQPRHVREVIHAGASGIAVMSGILESISPLDAVKEYQQELEVSQ
ncbi:transcriptional regulator [Fictibacillus phosphorivorans]|uniref:Transcriptional regulator n=1 Tax=Fictibacillus phosphorivorans TaxID=1221500 RepID=A0A163PR06_9BACL|nr:thiamine phosphate synthase [Fictibacillus phosphorivorans]KZE63985.1 transcriptional regulator [Fictibacillus phosphorivorans]